MAKDMIRPSAGSGEMVQLIQRLQQQMPEAQARLAPETVTGTSGGGAGLR